MRVLTEKQKRLSAERSRRWRDNNPDRWRSIRRKSSRKWKDSHKDETSAYHKAYYAQYYQTHKLEYSKYGRKSHLKSKYGITLEQFDVMAESQHYLCAICNKKRKLTVDHNHNTGAVRKLLCRRCNDGIGKLGDSSVIVQNAADYLRSHEVPQ